MRRKQIAIDQKSFGEYYCLSGQASPRNKWTLYRGRIKKADGIPENGGPDKRTRQ